MSAAGVRPETVSGKGCTSSSGGEPGRREVCNARALVTLLVDRNAERSIERQRRVEGPRLCVEVDGKGGHKLEPNNINIGARCAVFGGRDLQ